MAKTKLYRMEELACEFHDERMASLCYEVRKFCKKHDFDFRKCRIEPKNRAIRCEGELYKYITICIDVESGVPDECIFLYRKYCKGRRPKERMIYPDWLVRTGYTTKDSIRKIFTNEEDKEHAEDK